MTVIIDGTAGITFPNSSTQLVAGAPLTTPSFTTTIGVGAATASASGSGITFPATQSASSDANTLDDYEEGTFSPTVIGGTSGSATYGTQVGTYVKVGGWVFIQLYLDFSKNTISGQLNIANLPFTSKTGAVYYSTCCGYWSGLATAILNPTSFMGGNTTQFALRKITAASTNTNTSLTNADLNTSGNELMFSVFYQVA
jgi:hypothetical protein